MTGFGSADGTVLGGRLRIEIRSVNHRYFNSQFRLPLDLAGIEGELRDRLRALLERGHVAVSARWLAPPETEVAVSLDLARARQVVAALRELKKKLRLKGEPDLAFVARHADVLRVAGNGGGGGGGGEGTAVVTWADVRPLAEQATGDVVAMREREGKALATDLAARLDALEVHARVVAERAPARLAAEYERLKKAVAELAAGVRLDEQRLAQEIALLADRVDISEELVRFRTHVAACREALQGSGAVGKQLGFLAQELLREVNTMGSKANDATMTQAVIGMKGELERFRGDPATATREGARRIATGAAGRQRGGAVRLLDRERRSRAGSCRGQQHHRCTRTRGPPSGPGDHQRDRSWAGGRVRPAKAGALKGAGMRIITPQEVAVQTQNKYLGVLVAAKFARFVNEFPRDRSVDFEEKLTTRALDELVRAHLKYKLVRRRRQEV